MPLLFLMASRQNKIWIFVIIALAVFVILFIIDKHWLSKFWQWLVGFAGLLVLGVRKFWETITRPSKELNDIDEENNQIKLKLTQITNEVNLKEELLLRERALHEREIALLEKKIELRAQEIKIAEQSLQQLQSQGYQQYLQNLTPEERHNLLNNNIIDLP